MMSMRSRRWAGAGLAVLLLLVASVAWVLTDRPDLDDLGLRRAVPLEATPERAGTLRVTWLGVSTLLFDDGATQLLTDGFFSRPGWLKVAMGRPIAPDGDAIDRLLREEGISRLAAVLTVHSHYDHAMDAAEIARRTGAYLIGSASTANLGRGAGLPETRIVTVEKRARRRFGRFEVRFTLSRHAPIGPDEGPPYPGTIDEPLEPPAPVSAWREGGSYSIEISHPQGSAIVQGSAGFVEGALAGRKVDAVFLGVGGLTRLGREYAEEYWREIVGRTRPTRVFPIHFDDFVLREFGDVAAYPRAFDDLEECAAWLRELARASEPVAHVEMLPFRQAVAFAASRDDG